MKKKNGWISRHAKKRKIGSAGFTFVRALGQDEIQTPATYMLILRKIINLGGTRGTASEWSRLSACARRSRGSRGAGPLAGLQGGSAPLGKKILHFES